MVLEPVPELPTPESAKARNVLYPSQPCSVGYFCRMIRMMRDFILLSSKSLPINAVCVLEQGGIG